MDKFTKAYIICALWSSTDDETPLDENYGIEDIAPETLEKMQADCEAFQKANADDIGMDYEKAGHDFWLTRCGHGAGFWDGDWDKDVGERLTEASKRFGHIDLYVGDDGKIYA